MTITINVRKILWARAGNRCSYRHKGQVCGVELATQGQEKTVLLGEECHIVGDRPGSARYQADFPNKDGIDNLILMCPNHHTVIDQDPARYAVETLRAMKAEHERIIATMLQRQEIHPLIIKDSVFVTEIENADRAVGMEVNQPAVLSNVSSRLIASNVREAIGFSTNQGLTGIVAGCSACGRMFTFACTGPRPAKLRCPHCGHEE